MMSLAGLINISIKARDMIYAIVVFMCLSISMLEYGKYDFSVFVIIESRISFLDFTEAITFFDEFRSHYKVEW